MWTTRNAAWMQCLTSAAQRYRQNNLINVLMGFLLTVRYGCHCSYSTVSFPSECKTSIQFPSRLWGFHGLDPWKPWKLLRSSNIMVSLLVDGHLLLLLLPVWEWSIFHAGASSHNEMLNNEIKHCIAPIGTYIFNPRLVFTVKVWSRATKSFFFFSPQEGIPALPWVHVTWKKFPVSHTFFGGSGHPRETPSRARGWHLLDLLGGAELLLKVRMKATFIRHDAFDRGTYHPRSSPPFRIHTRPFTTNGALKECRPDKDRKPSSSCFKQCWKMERIIKT